MTNPMDEQGNMLTIGDLVVDFQNDVHIYCVVVDVKLPGLIAPAGASPKGQPQGMEMTGTVILQPLPIQKYFADKAPRIPNLIKVEKPPHFVDAVKKAKENIH